MVNESTFEIGSKPVMVRSRRVLVKLVLIQLGGCGHHKDGAIPSFFPDSRGSILGLSFDVKFVSKFFWKGGEKVKRRQICMEDPVTIFSKLLSKNSIGLHQKATEFVSKHD